LHFKHRPQCAALVFAGDPEQALRVAERDPGLLGVAQRFWSVAPIFFRKVA
jgi:hypothetical protein